ncbi:hypothetical protein C8R47DRAFT_1162751 [Mycena vitilis]|nr:hypothetical protein C8R47DRAFT_1162751 [Mycena vitilis]
MFKSLVFIALAAGTFVIAAPASVAACVARDDNGSPLLSNGLTDDGFVFCQYQAAGRCEYFTPSGEFSAGSSVCPDSITPGTSKRVLSKRASSSLATCVAQDDNGSPLLGNGITNDGFVFCQYQAAGRCEYFTPSGEFSAGSSVCPDSITPGTSKRVLFKRASSTLAICVGKDDNGSPLLSNGLTDDGFVFCQYQAAGRCEYFTPSGEFSAGSSVCPDSITLSKRTSASLARTCVATDGNGGCDGKQPS